MVSNLFLGCVIAWGKTMYIYSNLIVFISIELQMSMMTGQPIYSMDSGFAKDPTNS